jgi:hypothetical protein
MLDRKPHPIYPSKAGIKPILLGLSISRLVFAVCFYYFIIVLSDCWASKVSHFIVIQLFEIVGPASVILLCQTLDWLKWKNEYYFFFTWENSRRSSHCFCY